jgi:dTDP-L-rhamnose 4-epimerase
VRDIVQANVRALRPDAPTDLALNVGTGRPTSLLQLIAALNDALGIRCGAEVQHKFREGDIRHCYADISAARAALGYEPSVSLRDGIADLMTWLQNERPSDLVEQAQRELVAHGLTK